MLDGIKLRKKISFAFLLVASSLCLSFMSNTYSRYVAGTQGNVDMILARWQLLVNDYDIQDENNSEIEITPTIDPSTHVKNNVMAPTSKGHFDIDIDPSNVDVSFQYSITFGIDNDDIPDLIISKYAILPEDFEEGDTLEYTNIQNNVITNTLLYDNEIENFQFDAFTIRIFFEWIEGDDEEMDDEDDTLLGSQQDASFSITASISFEQLLDDDEEVENEGENNQNNNNENENQNNNEEPVETP